ncbi:MAG: flavodoxin family protein [Sulfolobales archaeon]
MAERLEKLRISIIYSSPRSYGSSRKISELLAELLRGEDFEVRTFNTYEMRIEPCMGCVSDNVELCRFPCVINDDARSIYEYLDKSHGLIIVSPIYWYNIPGPLKNLIDRLTVMENSIFTEGRSRLEGKVFGAVVIGNDVGSIAVIQNLMAIANSMGMIIPPWALAYYTGEDDPLKDEKFLLDLGNLARSTAMMIRILVKTNGDKALWYDASKDFREMIRREALEISRRIESSERNKIASRINMIKEMYLKTLQAREIKR